MPHRPHNSPDRQSSQHRRPGVRPTWRRIAVSYALIPAFVLLLWAISQPVLAILAVAISAGVALVGRRAVALTRCVSTCDALTLRPVETVEITVRQVDHSN